MSTDRPDELDARSRDELALQRQYQVVFSTPAGRIVLDDILRRAGYEFPLDQIDGPGAAEAMGVRYGAMMVAGEIALRVFSSPAEIFERAKRRARVDAGLEDEPDLTEMVLDDRQRRAE